MAKEKIDAGAQCAKIIRDVEAGVFAPVYLLMGEEPYYPDKACDAIIRHALSDGERDFNQTVWYGPDVDAGMVASEARSYPMMAERRLVVLKEAQNMRSLEQLAVYFEEPMETTVLVILMHGASADKRKAFYKNALKCGVVLESNPLRDYEMDRWISSYYSGRGLSIAPDAAALLAEYAGTDLGKIALETDKLLKNLPEGTTAVTAADIEKNVGISRQYSVFELTKALSFKDAPAALKIAAHIGAGARFFLTVPVSALYTHFSRILKYEALLMQNPRPSPQEKAAVLGVNPYFFREYDAAVSNYPLRSCMGVMSLLEEYDYRGKGGDGAASEGGDLLQELVAKILNS